MTTQIDDLNDLLSRIGEIAAAAASRYCRTTGEKADPIPESVMQMSVYEQLGDVHHLVPEMVVSRLWERNCSAAGLGTATLMPPEIQHMAAWKLDLVALLVGPRPLGDWAARGVIELKRWVPSQDDQTRIELLLKHVPQLQFGLRLTLVDVPPDHDWIADLRAKARREEQGFWVFPTDAECISGRRCSVVAHASRTESISAGAPWPGQSAR